MVWQSSANWQSDTSASLSTGKELEQISAFLDELEAGAETVLAEARALRRRLLALNDASEDRIYDLKVALEHLLLQLGGPSGQSLGGIIDQNGDPVVFSPPTGEDAPPPASGPYEWATPVHADAPTTPPVVPGSAGQFAQPPTSAPVSVPTAPPATGSPPMSAHHVPMPPPTGARVA